MFNSKNYFSDKKFFLKKLKLSDVNQNYLEWFKYKSNTKYILNSNFKNLKELKNYYKEQLKKKNLILGIFETKTFLHVGNIKFEKIDLKKKSAYVGIFIGNKNFQNQKLGSRSLVEACNLIFKKKNIFKIFLSVRQNNYKAIKSYKNSGFFIHRIKKNSKLIMLRNYFLSKIIIGTANFENNYGIVGKKKISSIEKKKINDLCIKYNISTYDLSEVYNLNLKVINKMIQNHSIIYFKLLNSLKTFNLKKIFNYKKLFKKKIRYFMVHGFKQILKLKNKKKIIYNLKKIYKYLPLGISVYSTFEVYKSYVYFKFKTVQAPINIFDQRFLNPKMLNFFKKKNIELCARSIYLQGILLQNKNFIKKNFPRFFEDFLLFYNKFSSFKQRKILITHFIFQNENIDKVVVGFENSKQFDELINILKKFYSLKRIDFSKFRVNKLKLIDPTNWDNK